MELNLKQSLKLWNKSNFNRDISPCIKLKPVEEWESFIECCNMGMFLRTNKFLLF
jgi:hypothetical protein